MRTVYKESIKTIFVDEISFPSLLKLRLFKPTLERIFHFEPLSIWGIRLIRLFRCLSLVSADVIRVTDHIGMVRNGNNEGQYLKCISDGGRICREISDTQLRINPLLQAMSKLWDGDKLRLYFEKYIEGRHISGEVTRECIRIGLTDWLIKNRCRIEKPGFGLLIQKKNGSLSSRLMPTKRVFM